MKIVIEISEGTYSAVVSDYWCGDPIFRQAIINGQIIPTYNIEPCEDAISRAEAIRIASGYCHFSNVPKELAKLPPVTPEHCEVEDAKQAYNKGFEDCRQAVLEQINCWIGSGEYGYTNATYYLTERVKHILSATPEPKMGHWIHFASGDDCSECGWSTGKYISPSKYCPNCGCKMSEIPTD